MYYLETGGRNQWYSITKCGTISRGRCKRNPEMSTRKLARTLHKFINPTVELNTKKLSENSLRLHKAVY